MRLTTLLARVALAGGLASACAPDAPTRPDATPSVPVTIHAALTSEQQALIAGLALAVTGPGIAAPIVINLPVNGAAIVGMVEVPAGADRRFTVHAYDELGAESHTGERVIDVLAGTNPALAITLRPLLGGVPIEVTIGTLAITLDVSAAAVDVGGNTTVTALVSDGGAPLAGGAVEWGVLNPVLVRLEPDAGGRAVRLTGRVAGTTTLTASYGGVTVSMAVAVSPGGAPTGVFRELAAGLGYTCALDSAGAAWCWGYNGAGQLGDGTYFPWAVPKLVSGGLRFASIATGEMHTCGVTLAGEAWCWGNNDFGQLGNGEAVVGGVPTPQRVLGGHVWRALAGSHAATCGITTAGALYCWGSGDPGAIGRSGEGGVETHTEPLLVTAGGGPWSSLSMTMTVSCALDAGGAATCSAPNPVAVSTASAGDAGTRWSVLRINEWIWDETFPPPGISLLFGHPFACGITPGHVALCWGSADRGQVGAGLASATPTTVPAPVSGPQGQYDDIAVGAGFACALRGGTAVCWGRNDFGQLGDGSRVDRYIPTEVAGGHTFVRIAAGLTHACGIRADGALYCWGANSWGELGDVSTTTRTTPVRVDAMPPTTP